MSKVEKCLEVRVEGEFGWPRISRNMLNTLFEIQLRFILPRNQEILTVCLKSNKKVWIFTPKMIFILIFQFFEFCFQLRFMGWNFFFSIDNLWVRKNNPSMIGTIPILNIRKKKKKLKKLDKKYFSKYNC